MQARTRNHNKIKQTRKGKKDKHIFYALYMYIRIQNYHEYIWGLTVPFLFRSQI